MTEDQYIEEVVVACLLEAGGDFEAGLDAAEYVLSLDRSPPQSVPLSFDINNRRAQGILNRTLQAVRGLNVAARKELEVALKRSERDSGQAIVQFVDRYRLQLARLLTSTQMAALLEGAQEIANKLPTLATFPGAVPPPPTLDPEQAASLVTRLEKMDAVKRAAAVYDLPAEHQVYVQQALAAKEASPPIRPPSFAPPAPPAGSPEEIHFPVIDEAVRNLAERNVVDRQKFDKLDAAARAKAFTVAGVEADETLTKIRDSLAENVREGTDYETWRKKVMADVDQGTFLSDAHQEVVFRTNIQTALSDGQEVVLQHPLVRSGFPYRQRDAIHDRRVRENHLALEQLGIQGTNIYRADDPVWQLFRVPWDYNDRCADTALTVRQAARAGIEEAQKWLDTGREPDEKAWVKMPSFQPPPGFKRTIASFPLSIQLSMQSMAAFANFNPNESRGAAGTPQGGEWVKNASSPTGQHHRDTGKPAPKPVLTAQPEQTPTGQAPPSPTGGLGTSDWIRSGASRLTDDVVNNHYSAWIDTFPHEITSDVGEYSLDERTYSLVNSVLRGMTSKGFKILPEVMEKANRVIKSIDKMMESAPPLKEKTRLYRGVYGDFVKKLLVVGSVIQDNGFVSTSYTYSPDLTWFGSKNQLTAMIHIDAPKGTRAIPASMLGKKRSPEDYEDEDELTLPRGSKFHIVHVAKDPTAEGAYHIHAELLP